MATSSVGQFLTDATHLDEAAARRQQESVADQKAKIAPHTQALQALRTKQALLMDPKTGQPLKGNEQEYNQITDQMQANIHAMRDILHPPPSGAMGALDRFRESLTDRLHLTNSLSRANKDQNKQDAADEGDRKAVSTFQQGTPLTPVQQFASSYKQATGNEAPAELMGQFAQKGIAPPENFKPENVILKDGRTISAQYDSKSGRWLDLNRQPIPPDQLSGATVAGGTADAKQRQDFDAFKKLNPDYQGTFEQWKSEQAAKGSAAGKPQNRDDRYLAILQKEGEKRPLSQEEQAYKNAYNLYVQKTKIDPGVARAAAFGAMRYVPIVDPSNPENVVLMRAGDAAKYGASTPQSIGFKTDQAITRYMTSGAGGSNINYFNTANAHLDLLLQAGQELNNGPTPLFNSLANKFATATGQPAPTNFNAVKSAVAGELSKTFKGTGATDAEISEINQTINNAQSPQQIVGAISYYKQLMGGKLDALKAQYEAGKEGKPNFGGTDTKPSQSASKGSRSLKAAMGLAINKGKSAAEVTQHLKSLGYEVTP